MTAAETQNPLMTSDIERTIPLPHAENIPMVLRGMKIFKNWRKSSKGGKIPVLKNGEPTDSYPVDAYTFEEAMEAARNNPELGVTMTLPKGQFCVLDIDYKGYDGLVTMVNGLRVPYAVVSLLNELLFANANAEFSQSDQGVHAILPGTYAGEHAKRGGFTREYCEDLGLDREETRKAMEQIGMEFYTGAYVGKDGKLQGGRHIVCTGKIVHPAALNFTLEPNPAADEQIKRIAEEFMGRGSKGDRTAIKTGDQHATYDGGANYTAAAAMQGLDGEAEQRLGRELARNIPLARLWDGDLEALQDIPTAAAKGDFSHSAARFQVLLACARAAQGDGSKIAELFARSALAIEKVFTLRTGRPLIEVEAERAAAAYHASVHHHNAALNTTTTVNWTKAHELQVVSIIGNQAKGGPAQKNAARALAADLLRLIEKGQHHTVGADLELHTGGLTAISERIGGATTAIFSRLEWMATIGLLSYLGRDSEGRPVVRMAADADKCALLARGSLPVGFEALPARPAAKKPRKKATEGDAAEVAEKPAKAAPEAVERPRMQYTPVQWAMWMLHRGAASVEEIAAGTGISIRTAKKQVKALQALELVDAQLHPLCSADEFEVKRVQEHLARIQKTLERRAEARAAYLEFRESRKKAATAAAEEAAEQAAWDAALERGYANAAD